MIDGTYLVSAETPLGLKRGEITFATDAHARTRVSLKVSGLRIALTRATCTGDEFELAGTISHFLAGNASFVCNGAVVGDEIHAVGRSGNMAISLKGRRKPVPYLQVEKSNRR